MRWLKSGIRAERGATAVIVGIMLVPLIGSLAIALDVGALYAERAQLQNGADAAALAIASDCADAEGCDDSAGLAAGFTDDNANDGAANVLEPDIDLTNRTVTVTDSTRVAGTGQDAIQHPFAALLGITETTVGARATAEWGGISEGPAVLPLALSLCEFERFGELNNEVKITIRYDENHPCTRDGVDIPGGFGWLEQAAGTCSVTVEADGTVPSEPGADSPEDCDAILRALEDTTILIPVFDQSTGNGGPGVFHIFGFASFHVTGWKFAGGNGFPLVNVDHYPGCDCNGGNLRFIQGYFEEWVTLDDAYEPGGPELNAPIVRLIN